MAVFTSASQLHSLSKLHSYPLPFILRSHSSSFSSFPRKSLLLSAPISHAPNPQPTEESSWLGKWNRNRFPTLPKKVRAVVDYRGSFVSDEDDEDTVGASRSTGSSTMEKIVEKLKKFGYVDNLQEIKDKSLPEKGSVEDIFYTEDGMLPNSRGGLGTDEEVRFPWEKPEGGGEDGKRRKESKSTVAELTLPEGELKRLRHLAIRTKSKTKVGGSGITKEIVDKIHTKWQTDEVVRLKCEGPPALNMKRMHEILERKTGGLVIWRSGSSISLYRGVSYEIPQPVEHQSSYFTKNKTIYKPTGSPVQNYRTDKKYVETLHRGDAGVSNVDDNSDTASSSPPEVKYEHEMDSLLDNLGPRCTDWTGCDPLPVDADLLPGFVPGYKPPFRILPYGVRRSLGMKDQTALRRLARRLPPHFALRRSRQHQGLATAMVKLWEKSSIAKIALKRGVQLTTSERMAEDIRKLTGGVLLCRNKDYIVFYRGKDFLAPELTEALLERERLARDLQDKEEEARVNASSLIFDNTPTVEYGDTGTLKETQEANARWGKQLGDNDKDKMLKAADVKRHADLVRKLERKFVVAKKKLTKAEKALGKVEEFLKPAENNNDPESISDEERFMFRKLGLKMKAFLLLGRRGVFDGTVENMHLHWKYRELVKIIVKAKTFAQVRNVALSLEAESGGILVSVDKISKGFAIIVYRGRDYHRPCLLRPKNLLTKRKALARSIELQRQGALNLHLSNMHKRVEKLKSELAQMEEVKEHGDEELYCKLDSTYLSDDEGTEDEEDDDTYLETIESTTNNGNEGEDEDGVLEECEEISDDSVPLVVSSYNQRISLLSSNSESSMLDNSGFIK